MSTDVTLLYVTIPSKEEGQKLAHALLEKRLIACANILPAHTAIYCWESKVQEDLEHVIILKTSKAKVHEAESTTAALHPYECPCIIQLDPTRVNSPFEAWLQEQLA